LCTGNSEPANSTPGGEWGEGEQCAVCVSVYVSCDLVPAHQHSVSGSGKQGFLYSVFVICTPVNWLGFSKLFTGLGERRAVNCARSL
jgi:hypothetical protein